MFNFFHNSKFLCERRRIGIEEEGLFQMITGRRPPKLSCETGHIQQKDIKFLLRIREFRRAFGIGNHFIYFQSPAIGLIQYFSKLM